MRLLHAGSIVLLTLLLISRPAAAQLTPEQMLETARQWERAVAMQDYDSITRLWSDAVFFQRVTANIDAPPELKQAFINGVGQNLGKVLVEQMIKQRGPVGGYKLLTIIKRQDGPHAIFRVLGESGLNYHELIADTVDGSIRIVDIHVYLTGESFVQTLRRAYIAAAASAQQKSVPPEYVALGQMQKAAAEQNFPGVLSIYDAQPDSVKQEKLVQITRLQAAMKVGDDAYAKALNDYATYFKGDVTADLIAVDTLLMAKKFKECYAAIDRIDGAVSGDPYLLVLRAGVAHAEGKPDTARMMCDKALVLEPTLLPAADALLTDALDRRDFKTAKALMLKMERTMYFTFGPLDQSPTFEKFLESPEYLEFEKERPRR